MKMNVFFPLTSHFEEANFFLREYYSQLWIPLAKKFYHGMANDLSQGPL